jgi:CBS domain-containing protein
MILKELMVNKPTTVRPDDSLHHAAQIMAWTEIHHLPVTIGDNRLVGILTERDLLAYRTQEPDNDPRLTPLSYAMHESPQTAGPECSLTEAAGRLAHSNIGCLPVTEKGRLVGLVTRTDVLAAEVRSSMEASTTTMTVGEVMTREPATVKPDDYLMDAAKLMSEVSVRHLPVVDDNGKAVGILSDRDIRAAVLDPEEFVRAGGNGRAHPDRVRDAMSRPPLRVSATENCGDIARLFIQFRASATVVTAEDGALEGIVSYIDLLRSISPGPTEPH